MLLSQVGFWCCQQKIKIVTQEEVEVVLILTPYRQSAIHFWMCNFDMALKGQEIVTTIFVYSDYKCFYRTLWVLFWAIFAGRREDKQL